MLKRNRRFIIGGIIILAALSYLITVNLREAMVFFKTPSELMADEGASKGKALKIGGMVLVGSLEKDLKSLTYRFRITDGVESVPVYFRGVPPDLFSEGKGAVIEGRLGEDGVFQATTIMAKHAEEYSPPKNGEYTETRSFIPDQKEKGR